MRTHPELSLGVRRTTGLINFADEEQLNEPSNDGSCRHQNDSTSVLHDTFQEEDSFYSRLTLLEISGSLGDLGTFIPLYVALCRQESLYPAPSLFWAGLCHLITGIMWDMPMPVQPMKSIAAVAIAEKLSREQVTAAGVWMGIFLTIMGLSNAIEWVNRIVPLTVVSGLQLGVGINLAIKGFHLVQDLTWVGELDCILLALFCTASCMYLLRESQHKQQQNPVALYLFVLGSTISMFELITTRNDDFQVSWKFHPSIFKWSLGRTSWEDWKTGLLQGAIPQLPLSTLNSVISVCCLAESLYPNRQNDSKLSHQQLCLSVGLMNLIVCPLGGMPNCHGAGGLAGQYKFGARRGASVIFLGTVKMLLAIGLGSTSTILLAFLNKFPLSVLGVLLATAGHELACTGLALLVQTYWPVRRHDQVSSVTATRAETRTDEFRTHAGVSLLTAAVILGLQKTHYGALTGWLAHMIYANGWKDWSCCRGGEPTNHSITDYELVHREPRIEVDDAEST